MLGVDSPLPAASRLWSAFTVRDSGLLSRHMALFVLASVALGCPMCMSSFVWTFASQIWSS